MGSAIGTGTGILGQLANYAAIANAATRPTGIPQLLAARSTALQDPEIRNALTGSQFLSRALGIGGSMVGGTPAEASEASMSPEQQQRMGRLGVEVLGPAGGPTGAAGKRYWSPNLPPLGVGAQADLFKNLAQSQAYGELFKGGGGINRQQAMQMLGLEGTQPYGFPEGTQFSQQYGNLFAAPPGGNFIHIGQVPQTPWTIAEAAQAMGWGPPGGGGPSPQAPQPQSQPLGSINGGVLLPPGMGTTETTGLRFDKYGNPIPATSKSVTQKPVPESVVQDAATKLGGLIDDLTTMFPWKRITWGPAQRQEFANYARQSGLINPRTRVYVTPDDVTTNDGQNFDTAKWNALVGGGNAGGGTGIDPAIRERSRSALQAVE